MQHNLEPIAEFIQYNNDKPVLDSAGLPVLAPVRVLRTIEDVKLLIEQNAPQKVIELFAKDASEAEQWQFAREYLEYLAQFAKAEAHNADLPVIGKDDNGDDVLAEPMALPEPPEKPAVKSVEEILAPYNRTLFKKLRAEKVANITVDVDDMVFDGDETSQQRMARSILVMNDTEQITWILSDNTPAQVTKAQLELALRKAGEAQTQLWSQP